MQSKSQTALWNSSMLGKSGAKQLYLDCAMVCSKLAGQVMESWRMILRGRGMSIDILDVRVFAGESAGFVTCTEVMEAGDSRGR